MDKIRDIYIRRISEAEQFGDKETRLRWFGSAEEG